MRKYHAVVEDPVGKNKRLVSLIAKKAKRPRSFVATRLFEYGASHAETIFGISEQPSK